MTKSQKAGLVFLGLAVVGLILIVALTSCSKDDTETITKSTVEGMCPGCTVNLIWALPLLGTAYFRGTASFTEAEDRVACPECGSHAVAEDEGQEPGETGLVGYTCYLCGHTWLRARVDIEGEV